MTIIQEPLTRKVTIGEYALHELREAATMMSLIAQWDNLTTAEKWTEFDDPRSPFREVPGFEPRWCAACHSETFFDYREDPEGACEVCGAWGSAGVMDRIAA